MNEEVDPEDMQRTIEQSARVRDQERRARERVMLAADRAPLRTRDRSPLRSRITKRATEGDGFQNRFLARSSSPQGGFRDQHQAKLQSENEMLRKQLKEQ